MNRYPPGPTDWLFGLPFVARMRRDPLGFLLHTARSYGEIAHTRVFGRHVYLVHQPDAIRDVLVTKSRSFCKVEQFMRPFRQVDGNGLVFSEGDFWLRQRRLMQPAFHARRMGRYAEAMVEQARRMVEPWHSGMEVNIADVMTHLTLRIVGKTLFGVELAGQEPPLREAVRVLSEAFTREANAVLRLPDWLPLPGKVRKRGAIEFLDRFIRDVIRQRRASGEDRGDLLSMLLLAVDEEGDGRGMTDEQARDEAMTLFNAGHDSTAAGLTWIWYLVAKHPEVQARLVEEVAAALGERPATIADLPRLSYAEQVVKESLRLYPPTWSLFPREALTETEVGGYVLPKASWVSILPWVLHRDSRWFPEPERFDPERFAPGRVDQVPKYAYIPFGAGPHICVGSAFATMEMVLILATVLQQFRVELAPGQGDAQPEPLIALRPKGGVRVTVHSHEVIMLRWLINKRLASQEKKLGVSLDYARHILQSSLRAFFRFIKIMPLAEYRRALPAEPFYAARIIATRHDDCGECVQITVNQARNAGISPALLQAVLANRMDELPEGVADACRFASAVVTASGEEEALRERIRKRYGEEALVELALTIAAGRFFPTIKRALGYAKACAMVSIQV